MNNSSYYKAYQDYHQRMYGAFPAPKPSWFARLIKWVFA